jgi:ADP-ribose pyrophosphatase
MSSETKTVGESIGWQRQESMALFESRWYDLRQDQVTLPAGHQITYTWMEHPGAALVVPFTPEGQLILIHTYRYPIDGWCWCVPGGGVGDKPELSIEEIAREELAEEAGAVAERLESLGTFYSATGVARLQLHYFAGHNVRRNGPPRLEAAEVVDRIEAFDVEEVLDMIYRQRALEMESAFGVLLAINRLQDWRPRKSR